MKVKSVSRIKLLFVLLPIMSVAFYALSSITGGGAAEIFTPPVIVSTISDMQKPPETGTPLDYTPEENIAFANWIIYNSTYFEGESVGDCKADLGFTKYTQNVRNARKVKNKTVFTETVSVSSLVSNAEQSYITANDIALLRPSAKVRGDNVTWSDSIYPISTDTFFAKYGAVPREITKYSVTAESVKSSRFISFGNNEYVCELELIPEIAGEYFKKEIRTRAGSSQDPVIQSVTITVTMDNNWIPISLTCVDSYSVSIPVLGSMNCVSTMTEIFTHIGEDIELEESKIFEPFIPAGDITEDPPIPVEKNASEYLAEAFEPYLSDEKLNLEINADILGKTRNIKAGIDIATMNINALVDDALYIGYDGNNTFIEAGGLKGYLPIDALSQLSGLDIGIDLDNLNLKDMLTDDMIGALFSDSDLTKSDGLITINLKFKLSDLLKSESELSSKAEKIELDVDLIINDGEKVSLNSIEATVKIDSVPVFISVTPAKEFKFPDTSEFVNLENAIGFISPALNTVKADAYRIEIGADISSPTFSDKIKANLNLNKDLTFDGTVSLVDSGVGIDLCYDGKDIYAKCGNIGLTAPVDNIGQLKEKLTSILNTIGMAIPTLPSLNDIDKNKIADLIINLDLNNLLSHIEEVSASEAGSLRAAINYDGKVYGVDIKHNETYLSSLSLDEIVIDGIRIKANIDLTVLETIQSVKVPETDYIDLCELANFVDPLLDMIEKRGFIIDIDAAISLQNADSLTIKGQLALYIKESGLEFQFTVNLPQSDGTGTAIIIAYENGNYYIIYDDLKVNATQNDLGTLMALLDPILPAFTPRLIEDINKFVSSMMPSTDIKAILNMIDYAVMPNSDTLEIGLNYMETAFKISVGLKNGVFEGITLSTTLNDDNFGEIGILGTLGIKKTYGKDEVENNTLAALNMSYTPASELIAYIDALINTFKQSAYRVTFDDIRVWYQDKTHKVNGYVEFMPTNGIPNLRLGFDVYETVADGVDADFEGIAPLHTFDIMITDGDPLQEIYLTYNGVKFKLTVAEVLNLLGNVKDALNIKDGTILDFVIPEDREKVSGEFLKDFNITALTDMSDMINGLLDIVTQVYYEAQDFMNDPDYDYTQILDTASGILNSLTKLLGIDSISTPTAGEIINLIHNLPKVSLENRINDDGSSTMTVYVNGTGFTLTRTDGENSRLADWGMSNLATKSTVTTFHLTLDCPDPSEVIIERPVYHDYNYATSQGGAYKKQELIDNILAGKIDGVALPYYEYNYIDYYETFTDDDIIPGHRYSRSYNWKYVRYDYTQNDNGDYIKVITGDNAFEYINKKPLTGDTFATKVNKGTYITVYRGSEPESLNVNNAEYWSKSYYDSKKFLVTTDNGANTTDLNAFYNEWFNKNYGMSYDAYYNTFLKGNCLNDLSHMSNLTTALLNTANLKDFHISGSININIIGAIKTNVPLDARVKLIPVIENGVEIHKPLIIVSVSTQKVALGALAASATQIYYWDGYMYFIKLDAKQNWHYVKMPIEQLVGDLSDVNKIMDYVFFALPLADWIQNMINIDTTSTTLGKFEDFFTSYYFTEGKHYLNINLEKLANNSNLSAAEIIIGTGTKNVGGYASAIFGEGETIFGNMNRTFVTNLRLNTKLAGAVEMKLNISLGIGEKVTTFRVPTKVNDKSISYNEYTIHSVDENDYTDIYGLLNYLNNSGFDYAATI